MASETVLVASGDLRETANRLGWPAQAELERDLAVHLCGDVPVG